MARASLPLIEVSRLRPGMYIVLELGWRRHPFPFNSFTLRDEGQIRTLRELGLARVRYCPERSRVEPLPVQDARQAAAPAPRPADRPSPAAAVRPAPRDAPPSPPESHARPEIRRLRQLEARQQEAARLHQSLLQRIGPEPERAAQQLAQLAQHMIGWLPEDGPAVLRLLGPESAEMPSGHEISVAALALALGRDAGLSATELGHLIQAALLHDVGKQRIPSFLHEDHGRLTEFERRTYRQHVAWGAEAARRLGLAGEVVEAIWQHHEHADGSGFPNGLKLDWLTPIGRVLALCNRYHNLVAPLHAEAALTPHQALQRLFMEEQEHFDPELVARLVRLLGVYPPGTLVELNDHRTALVVATQPGRTRAPVVQIIESPDRIEAGPWLALEPEGEVTVLRGLRPAELNPAWAARARRLARCGLTPEPESREDRLAA